MEIGLPNNSGAHGNDFALDQSHFAQELPEFQNSRNSGGVEVISRCTKRTTNARVEYVQYKQNQSIFIQNALTAPNAPGRGGECSINWTHG